MTIRKGESYVVEGLTEFIRKLNVDNQALFERLPEDDQQKVIEEYNDIAEQEDDWGDPVDCIEDLPEWVFLEDWREFLRFKSDKKIIEHYLEQSDTEYVHLFDGCSVHRIVELYPVGWDDPIAGEYGLVDSVPEEAWQSDEYAVLRQDPQGAKVVPREVL
jgi:hypothetical protein